MRKVKAVSNCTLSFLHYFLNFHVSNVLLKCKAAILTSFLVHKLCSNQNGMCSKFCLPRGENDRVCDCEEGNNVNSEGLCPGGMYIGDINASY